MPNYTPDTLSYQSMATGTQQCGGRCGTRRQSDNAVTVQAGGKLREAEGSLYKCPTETPATGPWSPGDQTVEPGNTNTDGKHTHRTQPSTHTRHIPHLIVIASERGACHDEGDYK